MTPLHDAARALVEKLWCTGDMQRGKALVLAFVQQAVASVEQERDEYRQSLNALGIACEALQNDIITLQQAVAEEREACTVEAGSKLHLRMVGGSTGNAWDTQDAIVAALRARTP